MKVKAPTEDVEGVVEEVVEVEVEVGGEEVEVENVVD